MNKILIIGSGNIGSRHLQGLKKVSIPLSIDVVDPNNESLNISKERYEQLSFPVKHEINFTNQLDPSLKKVDLAIIATSSDIRKEVTEKLVSKVDVKYIIFEKMLFQKKDDYEAVETLLNEKGITAWVNCSMRVTPFYADLKNKIKDKKIICVADGSQYGFITNIIHFIDYISFLSENNDFNIDTSFLDETPHESKRKGFLEFNGTLSVYFKNGSTGIFTCYPDGEAPVVVEIISKDIRALANETDRSSWISDPLSEWKWIKTNETLPFQSDLTNLVVEDILQRGQCNLTPYIESSKLHIILLEQLKNHLNENSSEKYDYYPFT